MTSWLQFLEQNQQVLTGACLVLLVLLCAALLLLWLHFVNFRNALKKLVRGSRGENLEKLLLRQTDQMETCLKTLQEQEWRMDGLQQELGHCVQRVGLVHYNAFDELGTPLSYSVALLDEHMNGLVLTGIHGQQASSSYIKEITRGKSSQELSIEEMKALKVARDLRPMAGERPGERP